MCPNEYTQAVEVQFIHVAFENEALFCIKIECRSLSAAWFVVWYAQWDWKLDLISFVNLQMILDFKKKLQLPYCLILKDFFCRIRFVLSSFLVYKKIANYVHMKPSIYCFHFFLFRWKSAWTEISLENQIQKSMFQQFQWKMCLFFSSIHFQDAVMEARGDF